MRPNVCHKQKQISTGEGHPRNYWPDRSTAAGKMQFYHFVVHFGVAQNAMFRRRRAPELYCLADFMNIQLTTGSRKSSPPSSSSSSVLSSSSISSTGPRRDGVERASRIVFIFEEEPRQHEERQVKDFSHVPNGQSSVEFPD